MCHAPVPALSTSIESPAWAALARIAHYQSPTWSAHFAAVGRILDLPASEADEIVSAAE